MKIILFVLRLGLLWECVFCSFAGTGGRAKLGDSSCTIFKNCLDQKNEINKLTDLFNKLSAEFDQLKSEINMLKTNKLCNSSEYTSSNITRNETVNTLAHRTDSTKAFVNLDEDFTIGNWIERWTRVNKTSPAKVNQNGQYTITPYGLKTTASNGFYELWRRFPEISTENETLILQYSAQFTDSSIRCSGAYFRLYECRSDPHPNTARITFGPNFQCRTGDDRNSEIWMTFDLGDKSYDVLFPAPEANTTDGQVHTFTLELKNSMKSVEVLVDGRMIKESALSPSEFPYPLGKQFCIIELEVYQYVAGVIFNNILITNDTSIAEMRRKQILTLR